MANRPKFSKRHYEFLADVLRESVSDAISSRPPEDHGFPSGWARWGIGIVRAKLVERLKADNPKFKPTKFIERSL